MEMQFEMRACALVYKAPCAFFPHKLYNNYILCYFTWWKNIVDNNEWLVLTWLLNYDQFFDELYGSQVCSHVWLNRTVLIILWHLTAISISIQTIVVQQYYGVDDSVLEVVVVKSIGELCVCFCKLNYHFIIRTRTSYTHSVRCNKFNPKCQMQNTAQLSS